jgi:hypothetical protein
MKKSFRTSGTTKQLGLIIILLLSIVGVASAVEDFPCRVKRSTDGCTVLYILQIGVDSDREQDVNDLQTALDACFEKKCYINCPEPSTKKCSVMVTIDVKKWADLGDDQTKYFHVKMAAADGSPSLAVVGGPNKAVGKSKSLKAHGVWRRGRSNNVYCHEAMHLCGLVDRYCGRNKDYDKVTWKEPDCKPGTPDPCDCPPPDWVRCGKGSRCCKNCDGYANDIMSADLGNMTCANILEVVDKANLKNCPASCCEDSSSCCGEYTGGMTGNCNCDTDGKRNLADVTQLISRVYITPGTPLCCEENGNTNGDPQGTLNLSDITRLIDYVYISHAETAECP